MQLSQCFGTQYSVPCTGWLRGRPFGRLGRGRLILHVALILKSYPVI